MPAPSVNGAETELRGVMTTFTRHSVAIVQSKQETHSPETTWLSNNMGLSEYKNKLNIVQLT